MYLKFVKKVDIKLNVLIREEESKGTQGNLEVTDMFVILTVVMVSQVCVYF